MSQRINKIVRCQVGGAQMNLSLFDGAVTVPDKKALTPTQQNQVAMFSDAARRIDAAEFYDSGLAHVVYQIAPSLGVTFIDDLPVEVKQLKPEGRG